MQAAVTLKLLHDAGAPLEFMSVLTDAYGVDIHDVSLVWVRPGSDEHEVVEQNRIEGTGSDGFQRGGRPYVEPSLEDEDEDEESSAEPAFVPWNSDAIDRGLCTALRSVLACDDPDAAALVGPAATRWP